jgi:hypothetical protein
MAKWVRSGVLDNGLTDIKTNATKILLIKAYTAGDSYATVVSNLVAEASVTSGELLITSSGSNRVLTTPSGKTGIASAASGATPNLHLALTDGTANVIWVTDETTDQQVSISNVVNFPVITYTSNQPT